MAFVANSEDFDKEQSYKLGCESLRLAGYKLTPCRRFVLKRTIEECGPHSVQTLLDDSGEDSGIDQSTLYRTLETLCELDMLEAVRLPSKRQAYYAWKHRNYHNHVVCRKCGSVLHPEILGQDELRAKVEEITGYTDIHFHLDFSGICEKCGK